MSLGGLFFLFMLSPFSLSTACPVLALHLILNICTKISLKRDKKWMSYQFSKLFIDSGQSYSLGHFRPLRQDLLLLGHLGTNAIFVSTPVYRALWVVVMWLGSTMKLQIFRHFFVGILITTPSLDKVTDDQRYSQFLAGFPSVCHFNARFIFSFLTLWEGYF